MVGSVTGAEREVGQDAGAGSAGSLNSYGAACCPPGQVRQGLDRAAVVWGLLVGATTRRREHRVAVMAKPVLVVVDAEDASLQALTLEL